MTSTASSASTDGPAAPGLQTAAKLTPAAATTASLQDALAEALAIADAAADVRDAARRLRERFAPRRVVVVDASDMRDDPPAATGDKAQLHFAASDGHCWSVSGDGANAAGFFVSWKD
jgi:hypothetical protein